MDKSDMKDELTKLQCLVEDLEFASDNFRKILESDPSAQELLQNVEAQCRSAKEKVKQLKEKVEAYMHMPPIMWSTNTIDQPIKTLAAVLWMAQEKEVPASVAGNAGARLWLDSAVDVKKDLENAVALCSAKERKCRDSIVGCIEQFKKMITDQIGELERTATTILELKENREGLNEQKIEIQKELEAQSGKLESLQKEHMALKHTNSQYQEKLSHKMEIFDEAAKLLEMDGRTGNKEESLKQGLEELCRLAEMTKQLSRVRIVQDSSEFGIYEIWKKCKLIATIEIATNVDGLRCSVTGYTDTGQDMASSLGPALNHALKTIGHTQPFLETVNQVLAYVELPRDHVKQAALRCIERLTKQVKS